MPASSGPTKPLCVSFANKVMIETQFRQRLKNHYIESFKRKKNHSIKLAERKEQDTKEAVEKPL